VCKAAWSIGAGRRVFVTFSGLDGAGKSTLIGWLTTRLGAAGRPMTVFHMNDHIGVYAYLRFVRDRVRGSNAERNPPTAWTDPLRQANGPGGTWRAVRYRLIWNKTLRRLIYPFDLAVFLVYRFYHEVVKGRVLVMDRYVYDTLVDVFEPRQRWWLRALEALTPTPTLAVFLDVTPEESFRRKQEYSIEYLTRRSAAYKEIFTWVPSAVRLVNCDLATSQSVLGNAIHERLRV
jgi:thymidylate kinase